MTSMDHYCQPATLTTAAALTLADVHITDDGDIALVLIRRDGTVDSTIRLPVGKALADHGAGPAAATR